MSPRSICVEQMLSDSFSGIVFFKPICQRHLAFAAIYIHDISIMRRVELSAGINNIFPQ